MAAKSAIKIVGIFSILLNLNTTLELSTTCGQEDFTLPRDLVRICKVYPGYVEWLSDCNEDDDADYSTASACQVYVGMKIVAKCPVSSSALIIQVWKGNRIRNATGMFVISNVQLSDTGEYECRTILENSTVITSFYFNISVLEDVIIGLRHGLCSTLVTFNTSLNCCWVSENPAIFTEEDDYLSLYSFGGGNFSVKQKWITPFSEHYSTDINLSVVNVDKSMKTFSIKIQDFPTFINAQLTLKVLAIVTITNQSSISRPLCYPIHIKGNSHLITPSVNTSLPEDLTSEVGSIAMFDCHFSSPQPCDEVHILEYYLLNESSPKQQFHQPCDYSTKDYYLWKEDYSLNVSIVQRKMERYYHYKFYVYNVSIHHNASMLTCSLISNAKIQWQNSASLIVITPDKMVATSFDSSITAAGSAGYSVYLIAVFLTSIFVITVTILISGIFCYRIRNNRNHLVNSTQLTKTESISSFDSSVRTRYRYRELLSEQSISEESFQKEGFDGENGTEQRKNYFEVTNNIEKTEQIGHTRRNISQVGYSNNIEGTCQEDCAVYVSYTEEKADWVYDYLKPLLESWSCRVILHDEDMIPGFTVSGERQRLILQAHRVILVVSPDYSSSPWCLYELQHAITKDPVLFKGKIIPILVDNCITLPTILKGIVPLIDSVTNFEQKLHSNICSKDVSNE